MQILLFIALLLIGGVLNFIKTMKFGFVRNLAAAYISIMVFISICTLLFYFAGIKNTFILKGLLLVPNWFGSAGHLMLGYLIFNISKSLLHAEDDSGSLKKLIRLTLIGVTVLTGFSFIIESCWSIQNFTKILHFFTTSGYTIAFLYFITIAEALGGLGLLLHFKLKTGPFAAAGLMLIMIGAMYTHRHNHDPFSESYAAFSQFITLSLMLVIYYFEREGNYKPANQQMTVIPETTV